MKKRNYLFIVAAIAIGLLIYANKNTKDSKSAEISWEVPKNYSENDILITTMYGKMLIMADIETAQKLNTEIKKQAQQSGKDFHSLADFGLGNGFAIKIADTTRFCTVVHGCIGIEKYVEKIDADIAIVREDAMPKKEGSISRNMNPKNPYEMDTTFKTGDSLFIKGYRFNDAGSLEEISIKGVGFLSSANDFKGLNTNLTGNMMEYVPNQFVLIKLDKNEQLDGLSGSPVFNKLGRVVGVYGGRLQVQSGNKDVIYLRISLFKRLT